MTADDLISPHFRAREVAYRRRGRIYLPDAISLRALSQTLALVLEPLRSAARSPIYVVPGGGYDPLRDADGEWISHRTSETTQHHHGGAVDFRIGARGAQPWDMGWASDWLEARLAALGIPGGIGVYDRDRFIHVDLRGWRARWRQT